MTLQDELVCHRYSTLKVCNRVSPEPPILKNILVHIFYKMMIHRPSLVPSLPDKILVSFPASLILSGRLGMRLGLCIGIM